MTLKSTVILLFYMVICFHGIGQTWESIITPVANDISEGVSIKVHNENQYFAGVYRGSFNLGSNSLSGWAYDDIFIGKANLLGITEWVIPLNGNKIERTNTIDIINNQVVVSGTFSDTLLIGNGTIVNNHQRAVFLAHFDTLGNHISTFLPDVHNAEFKDFVVDSDGNYIICGEFYNHFNYGSFSMYNPGVFNFFLLKYDPVSDSIIWGVHASLGSSEGEKVIVDDNNDIFVTGMYNEGTNLVDTVLFTGSTEHNIFISKFDTDGNRIWLETVHGAAEVHSSDIVVDDSSNVFLIGEFEGVIDVGGTTYNSGGFYDVIFVKYTQDGTVQWTKVFGGVNSDEGYGVVLDQNMDPIVMVESEMNLTYNGQTLSVNGWNEPMLLKVRNSDGGLIWWKSLESTPGTGLVNAMDISIEGTNIAITGINRTSILFNSNNYVAANSKDFYTVILSDSLTYHLEVESLEDDLVLSLFPNPAHTYFKIKSSESMESIKIFSMSGKLIEGKEIINTTDTTINLYNYPRGMYLVKVISQGNIYTNKISVK